MDKISVDTELLSKLNGTDKKVEMVDEQGHTIGYFVPTADYERMAQALLNEKALYQWANSQISEEELAKSMEDEELYTTDEVMAYLESL